MSVEAVKRESWCEYRSPELSSLVSREDVFLNIKVPFLILKENDLKPPVLLRLVVNGIIAGYHGNICWDNRLTAIDWLENLELFYRGICQMYWQKTKFKVISSLGGTLFLFSVLHGPGFTWSGLRIKIFCNSRCFTRFFQSARAVPSPASSHLEGASPRCLIALCLGTRWSWRSPKIGLKVWLEKGALQSQGLVSVTWGSAVSRLAWKNRGYEQRVFKSLCTAMYLTTDVIASLMLCLKTYLDAII